MDLCLKQTPSYCMLFPADTPWAGLFSYHCIREGNNKGLVSLCLPKQNKKEALPSLCFVFDTEKPLHIDNYRLLL